MLDQKDKIPTTLGRQQVDIVATITRRMKPGAAPKGPKGRAAQQAKLDLEGRAGGAAGEADEADDSTGDDDELYDISLSSDTPIDRGWYTETLDHSADAVDLSRAATGINLLWNHNSDQPIGRISDLKVGKDGDSRKLNGTAKFYSHAGAQEKRSMVDEGLREVSVGYTVSSYEYTPGTAKAGDAYVAKRWTPLEASLAPVPADNSVSISSRAADGEQRFPVSISVRSTETNAAPAVQQERTTMNETERAAADLAAAKQKEPTEIARLARTHGMSDKVADWLAEGKTLNEVRGIILDAKANTGAAETLRSSTTTGLDLPAKEAREYSYSRAILAAAELREGRKTENCLELEVSTALERTIPGTYARKGGLLIPTSLRNSGIQEFAGGGASQGKALRAMLTQLSRSGTLDSATVNALKEVVFTEYGGELIEILRNMAMVISMGARMLTGLGGPVAFPRQLTDSIAQWIAENPGSGGQVTNSNPTTDLVTLAPHTLMASSAYSRQLLVQASIDVEAFVRSSISAAHALALDLAAIHGTGLNNQPLGIYNQVGVGTVDYTAGVFGVTGNKIAYAGLIQQEVLVANANALLGTLGYMTTPSIGGDAKNSLKFPGAAVAQGAPLWDGPLADGEMNGYRARCTNQISKTMGASGAPSGGTNHGLIYGNWADVLIGSFGGAMEMIVDPYSLKKQGLIEVTSFQMADVAIRHPGSFAVGINLAA
jgi:HK97 family phage major capsid protein/HK97 family phage prohead protease